MFGDLRLGYWFLLAIVAAEFIICTSLGTAPITALFGIGGLSKMLPGWILLPLLWFGYLAIEITRRKVKHPFKAIRMLIYRHRFWLFRGMLFIAIIIPLARAFTSYKSAIPDIVPYFADALLIDADKALFGVDPWRITHAVIGPLGTAVIDRVYALWFVVMMLLLGWLCFTGNQKLQLRGLPPTMTIRGADISRLFYCSTLEFGSSISGGVCVAIRLPSLSMIPIAYNSRRPSTPKCCGIGCTT